MKILEDKTIRAKFVKVPLEYRCPYCNSLLLVEEGDFKIRYNLTYTNDGRRKKCHCYVAECPCCKKEFNLKDYENI